MRVHALDTAKGLGILLVVFGHAWRGNYAAGLGISDPVFRAIDTAIYAFHMPLFFFLAGLLFWETLNKRHLSVLLLERIQRLLWPMALWTWIFVGVKLLAGQSANQPVGLEDVQWFPLPPYEHLWFLWALFLIQIFVALVFASSRWTSRVFRVLAGVTGLALILILPFVDFQSDWFAAALRHTPYFVMAVALGWTVGMRPSAMFAGLSALLFCVFLYLAGAGQVDLAQSMVMVLCVYIFVAYLDRGEAETRVIIHTLRWLGQASMAIYLCHTIFSAGLREALQLLGFSNAAFMLMCTTLIGIALPAALFVMTRGNRVGRILGL